MLLQNFFKHGFKLMMLLFFVFNFMPIDTNAKNSRIDNPDFQVGKWTFNVTSAILSDSTTRLNIDIYGRPKYWVRVEPDTYLMGRVSGKKYILKDLEGAKINEQVYLSDSAYLPVTFVFDALAPEDSIVDLIDSGAWTTLGIKLFKEQPKKYKTHLRGTVDDYPSASWMLLFPGGEDPRVNKATIIPVRNGKVDYTFETDNLGFFDVCFGIELLNGSWSSVYFASTDTIVDFVYNKESDFSVKSGFDTENFYRIQDAKKKYFEDNVNNTEIDKRYREMPDEEAYTPEAYRLFLLQEGGNLNPTQKDSVSRAVHQLVLENRIQSDAKKDAEKAYMELVNKSKAEFYRKELAKPSLAGLFILREELVFNSDILPEFYDLFMANYADTLTNVSYHSELLDALQAGVPSVGKKYLDFSVPDTKGNVVKISDVIGGKVAVIDLWASWCGPCRFHSRELIPLYEKYRDKGFVVIGVAREENAEDMEAAIKQDGYSWTNLLELNDENRIWLRYGIGNSAGRILVVDRDGSILAIDPKAEEIEAILIDKL